MLARGDSHGVFALSRVDDGGGHQRVDAGERKTGFDNQFARLESRRHEADAGRHGRPHGCNRFHHVHHRRPRPNADVCGIAGEMIFYRSVCGLTFCMLNGRQLYHGGRSHPDVGGVANRAPGTAESRLGGPWGGRYRKRGSEQWGCRASDGYDSHFKQHRRCHFHAGKWSA